MKLEIFTPDASWLWKQAGYFGKFETIIFGIPLVIWAAGSVEGIARTTIGCSKVVLNKIFQRPAEASVEEVKNEFLITQGCLALAGLSSASLLSKTIPYAGILLRLPAYYITEQMYESISEQTRNYERFKRALLQVEKQLITAEANALADRLCSLENIEELYELTDILLKQLKNGFTVTQKDLDNHARQLQGTLIYRNWSYTATYLTVKTSYKTAKKVVETSIRLIQEMFSLGLVKRVVKFSVNEAINEYKSIFELPKIPLQIGEGQ